LTSDIIHAEGTDDATSDGRDAGVEVPVRANVFDPI
jgi:hypothetical protein